MTKNMVRWLVLFALVAWQVLMPVTSAGALQGGPDRIPIKAPNGEAYYLIPFSEVKTIAPPKNMAEGMALVAASGCKSRTDGVDMYDAYGIRLFRYQQKVDWCYNGTTITSVSHVHTPTVYMFTWRYNGILAGGHVHSGGVGQASYRAYSQASFCQIVGTVCTWYVYPWVDQTVRGTGTSSGSAGY